MPADAIARKRTHNVTHRYIFEITVNGRDLSSLLAHFKLMKKLASDGFVIDMLILKSEGLHDPNQLKNSTMTMRIYYMDLNDTIKEIYSNEYIITEVSNHTNKTVIVRMDTIQKNLLYKKASNAFVCESVTCIDAIKEYMKNFDNKYNFNSEVFILNNENINKHIYEKILFPVDINYLNIKNIAKKYYAINAPFYVFFDEYNFGDAYKQFNWFRLGFYDFTDPKKLRGVTYAGKEQSNIMQNMRLINTYVYTDEVLQAQVVEKEGWYYEPNSYIPKKLNEINNNRNNFKAVFVPDTISNAKLREKKAKKYFENTQYYADFVASDFDIRQVQLGKRLVIDDTNINAQYMYTVMEIEYTFSAAESLSSESAKKVNDVVFKVDANIKCLMNFI